ncbi:MAG: CsiV family protein [Gammaproteobacteria bacterium]
MKKYAMIPALILCLSGITLPVYAESWFQVEVIVFEYTRPDTDGESWYTNPGLPGHLNSIELIQGLPAVRETMTPPSDREGETADDIDAESTRVSRVAYLELPEDHKNMAGIYRVLNLSAGYRPLYHATWQQPGLDGSEARYVHIEGLRETTGTGMEIEGNNDKNTRDDDFDTGTASVNAIPEMSFDGMIRLRSTHFLHLDVDTAYFPPDPSILQSETALGQGLPAYQFADYVRLQESRRIRLKELHYFDHPLFGVIVQVTRIEDETKSEE